MPLLDMNYMAYLHELELEKEKEKVFKKRGDADVAAAAAARASNINEDASTEIGIQKVGKDVANISMKSQTVASKNENKNKNNGMKNTQTPVKIDLSQKFSAEDVKHFNLHLNRDNDGDDDEHEHGHGQDDDDDEEEEHTDTEEDEEKKKNEKEEDGNENVNDNDNDNENKSVPLKLGGNGLYNWGSPIDKQQTAGVQTQQQDQHSPGSTSAHINTLAPPKTFVFPLHPDHIASFGSSSLSSSRASAFSSFMGIGSSRHRKSSSSSSSSKKNFIKSFWRRKRKDKEKKLKGGQFQGETERAVEDKTNTNKAIDADGDGDGDVNLDMGMDDSSNNSTQSLTSSSKTNTNANAKIATTTAATQEYSIPYGSSTPPAYQLAAGMTHATFLYETNPNAVKSNAIQIHQTGTIHGIIYPQPTSVCPKIPLQCTQIACGRRHTLALFENKVVMSWGSGYFGQLGHGVDHTGSSNGGGGGSSNGMGDPYPVFSEHPVVIERLMSRYTGGHAVKVIAGGMQSAVIIADDLEKWREYEIESNTRSGKNKGQSKGTSQSEGQGPSSIHRLKTRVIRFGGNKYGQCAVEGGKCNAIAFPTPMMDVYHPETSKKVVFVDLALGKLHSVGMTNMGELYSWGSTASGRCGHGEFSGHVSGGAGGNGGAGTGADANRNGRGAVRSAMRMRNGILLPKRVDALRNVKIVQVCAGDAHTLALSGSGRVFSWGNNASGQLGVGHSMHLMSPRLVADLDFGQVARGFAKQSQGNGGILSDKNNDSSRLGSVLAPIHYPSSPPNKKIAHKSAGASPIVSNGSKAGTGIDASPPTITSIYAAGAYSAAISSIGDIYTWGCGEGNQLGHPMPTSASKALPLVDLRSAMPRSNSGLRTRDSQSFDSRLNVLLPRRVECLRHLGLKVEEMVTSSNFMLAICSRIDKKEPIEGDSIDLGPSTSIHNSANNYAGKTLFELEHERKEKSLDQIDFLRGRPQSQQEETNEDEQNANSEGISCDYNCTSLSL